MKRSEINKIMRESLEFLKEMHFFLPPFATWTPEDWKNKGPECGEIIEQQLGWDITDFGSGVFKNLWRKNSYNKGKSNYSNPFSLPENGGYN